MAFRSTTDAVQVEGLAELRAALAQAGRDGPKKLADANKAVAVEVADTARGIAAGLGSVFAKVGPTIRGGGGGTGAWLLLGGQPYSFGAEFGALRYKQFPPWRGNQWPSTWVPDGVGYMLHPAIRQDADKIVKQYDDMVVDLTRKAFPE